MKGHLGQPAFDIRADIHGGGGLGLGRQFHDNRDGAALRGLDDYHWFARSEVEEKHACSQDECSSNRRPCFYFHRCVWDGQDRTHICYSHASCLFALTPNAIVVKCAAIVHARW